MQVGFELRYGDPESIVSDVTQSLKDHPEVRKNYTLAAQALLASSSAASGRGDIDAATHYMDRAKAVYQQGIARWPDDLQFSIGLAEVCLQRNDMSGAESALKTLAARPRWKNQPAPLTVLAQIEMRAKHLDVAESLLKQALALDANYVQARTLLADCLVAEKEYEDALATLKPACGEFVVLDKYVRLLLQLSRGSEAEDKVVAAREKDPNNPGLTNLLIDVYQSEHKADEALKLANASISADPTNIGAYLRRGELEASGVNADLDAARKDLRYYADAIPTDVRASMMLAEVLDASQDHDGAIRELQSAVKYAPLERQPRLMLLREYLFAKPSRDDDAQHLLTATLALPEFQHDPVFEMQEAKLFAEKGDGDQAFTAAHDAIAHAQDKSSMVDDYLSILLLAKKYSLLLDESKGYAADPKTNWSVFVYRGSAKHLSGDDSGAIAEFQTALDRAGADKGTHAAREVVANIAAQLGADKALELIAPREKNSAFWTLVSIDLNSMKKAPNAKAAEANTAAALAAAESANGSFDTFDADDQNFLLDRLASLYIRSVPPKSEQALAVWQKMYARNPNNVDAMNNIASVLSDMTTPPRPKDALVWSQKAYDLCKASNLMIPAIYDTHGWVLIQCGRLDDGIAVLHEAIDRSDFPDAHYHLAMGYLKQKHPEDAKRELETASQMLLTPNRTFTLIDPDLKAKIDSALKQADQNIQASAGSVPPG
jgi:predicted Zn-dependent protease